MALPLWIMAAPVTKAGVPEAENTVMDAADVAYAFRKAGFEAPPSLVSQWVGKRRFDWVQATVAGLDTAPVLPVPRWTAEPVRHWGFREWSNAQRSAYRAARAAELDSLRHWWINQMVHSPSPMAERMVMFWHNTFVSSYSGLRHRTDAVYQQHRTIRELGLGNYRALLAAMIRDPALLIYLDNTTNTVKKPNENFARELLEIFTLGDSNYTEYDIKATARALTGWHVAEFGPLAFRVNDAAMDRQSKTIFNQTGHYNGDDLVDLILSQRASAEHVVRRLWLEFVSHQPAPQDFVGPMVDTFVGADLQIKPVLNALLRSSHFWSQDYAGTSVKSPVELAIGLLRAGHDLRLPADSVHQQLSAMGQALFAPPNVSGWGYGEYWLDPSFLLERDKAIEAMTSGSRMMPVNASMTRVLPTSARVEPAVTANPAMLTTDEMVLMYFTPPSPKRGIGVSVMFDGLQFDGRRWDYFGVAYHQDQNGQYRVTLRQDRCQPDCLEVWPVDLKRKKITNEVRFYVQPRSFEQFQYQALNARDQALIAALLGQFPEVMARVTASHRHRDESDVAQWSARMKPYVELVEAGHWGASPGLVETKRAGASSASMQAQAPVDTVRSAEDADSWERAVKTMGVQNDLSTWLHSLSIGGPLRSFDEVVASPAFQIK